MRATLRKRMMSLAAALATLTLVSCATTQMKSEWRDPKVAGAVLKGQPVLVVCQSRDPSLRRICEDQWALRLQRAGAAGIQSYAIPNFPADGIAGSEETRSAAERVGAPIVASVQLALDDLAVVNPAPQVGIGIAGGSGGYRSGGFSAGGLGLSFPLGWPTAAQGMVCSAAMVDAASGTVFWSGSAAAPPSGTQAGQVAELTQLMIDSLLRAGLLH
ncbi:MAG: hypothetical protein AW08_00207 [Candidatus Accumulibacter adjunctus]|uniref:DUF4136 domain-containing protein n=1 Tax=Candidatus Accumulibacter adjunctus TaxID=1454001 RepID=A0A011PTM2_9PROT|nr:MAG: hypothetical protein AW08_00207 [Candidatus Accumulibacter adjunctus]